MMAQLPHRRVIVPVPVVAELTATRLNNFDMGGVLC
jgi:hypothetical protein